MKWTAALLLATAACAQTPPLPELRHERVITQHPKWMSENLRVAYGHWERVKPVPLEEWLGRIKAMGAQAIIGLGSIPDSPINHLTPTPDGKPGYEWVRQYAETAHKLGLKMVIYGNFYHRPDEVLQEHPEWRELDANGKPANGNPCFSSPWVDAFEKRLVGLLRESPFEGIMIDAMHSGRNGCYNPYCVRAFKKRFGVDPPTKVDPKDPVWQRWNEFQAFTREEMYLRLTEAAHKVYPEFAMMINGNRGWSGSIANGCYSSTHLHEVIDALHEETGWDYATHWVNPYAGPVRESFQNTYLRSRRGDGWSYRWTLTNAMPLAELRWRSINGLAHGNTPHPTTGSVLNWRGVLWNDIREREKYILHSEALPWLGLVYSEKTLAWRYGAVDDTTALPYLQNIFGAFSAVLEAHLPVDVLSDWQLAPEALRRYRVIVLPNTAALSDEASQALRRYVENGGGLVATFETSLFDETARQRKNFSLADLFGASYGQHGKSANMRADLRHASHPIAQDEVFRLLGDWQQGAIDPGEYFDIMVRRSRVVEPYEIGFVLPQSVSDGVGEIRAGSGGDMRVRVSGASFPAFTARQVGKGRVVYIPVDLGRAYFLNHMPTSGTLLERAIRWAAREAPPAEIDGSQQVETIYFTQPGRLIVHLLNNGYSYGFGASPNPESYGFRREVIPVHDLKVRLNRNVKRVLLVPGEQSLAIKRDGAAAEVVVPKLEMHSMLVVE